MEYRKLIQLLNETLKHTNKRIIIDMVLYNEYHVIFNAPLEYVKCFDVFLIDKENMREFVCLTPQEFIVFLIRQNLENRIIFCNIDSEGVLHDYIDTDIN